MELLPLLPIGSSTKAVTHANNSCAEMKKRSHNTSQELKLPSHYSNIPIEFILQMGSSDITHNSGVNITTHVIDGVAALDKHIAELRSYLECKAKVVGLDIKTRLKPQGGGSYHNNKPDTIVLYVFRRCLIILLDCIGDWGIIPQSLVNFSNDPKVCFVGAATIPAFHHINFCVNGDVGVKVGDLAARVLRRPELTEFSLPDVAKEAGVSYCGQGATAEVVVASETVFSDEEIKDALTDAYTYYQIGYKLLTSL